MEGTDFRFFSKPYYLRKLTHSVSWNSNLAKPRQFREDTLKKKVFFSGRTTKGVGRVNPPSVSGHYNYNL